MVLVAEPPSRIRIRRLLLAGNPYDAFLLEEAGLYRIIQGKESSVDAPHSPGDMPCFDIAGTGEAALKMLATGFFDMLVADYVLPDMSGPELAQKVREHFPGVAIAVMSSDTDLGGATGEGDGILEPDLFIGFGAQPFIRAIIRLQEDEKNATDLLTSGAALGILLVEDEPNFYSHFVPLLYERIRRSAMELIPEDRHPQSEWEPIYNRPLVLLRRTFEDSCEVLYKYRLQMMAIITDMCFPVMGELKTDAGLRLLYRARAINGHLPVAVHSRDLEHRDAAQEAGATFIWKDSPKLLSTLDKFLTDVCGFGHFVFRWPAGDRYGVATNLQELRDLIADVPEVVFEHHALHFDFSTWLGVHGYQALAMVIREISIIDPSPRLKLLSVLDQVLHGATPAEVTLK